MKDHKKPILVACTVGCALTIGFVMESAHKAQYDDNMRGNSSAVEAQDENFELGSVGILPISQITLTSANPIDDLNERSNRQNAGLPQLPQDPTVPQMSCTLHAKATPADNGFIDLKVYAPCQKNEAISIQHAGLMFSEKLAADGGLVTQFPAMTELAKVTIEFDGGRRTVATTHVPDFQDYERIALQWDGAPVFSIHAREIGADTPAAGQYVQLGNATVSNPRMAEIYSYPANASEGQGDVSLSFEAEVTAANCDQNIDVQTLEKRLGGSIRMQEMSLQMPDCSSIGDFLVFNNLVEDVKIAAR